MYRVKIVALSGARRGQTRFQNLMHVWEWHGMVRKPIIEGVQSDWEALDGAIQGMPRRGASSSSCGERAYTTWRLACQGM